MEEAQKKGQAEEVISLDEIY
jgi:hypothetical protein